LNLTFDSEKSTVTFIGREWRSNEEDREEEEEKVEREVKEEAPHGRRFDFVVAFSVTLCYCYERVWCAEERVCEETPSQLPAKNLNLPRQF
jgi:hypothetical protein